MQLLYHVLCALCNACPRKTRGYPTKISVPRCLPFLLSVLLWLQSPVPKKLAPAALGLLQNNKTRGMAKPYMEYIIEFQENRRLPGVRSCLFCGVIKYLAYQVPCKCNHTTCKTGKIKKTAASDLSFAAVSVLSQSRSGFRSRLGALFCFLLAVRI